MRLAVISSSLFLVLAAVLPLTLQAKTTDRNAPMDVAADHSETMLGDDSDSILSGNVRITQGSLEVTADRAVIHRKKGDISEVVLTGGPATLKQVADNGDPMSARANQIVYTMNSEIIVLSGDVVVQQPRGTLSGQTIKYDLNSGRLDGGGDGSRVQMRILPKNASGGSAN